MFTLARRACLLVIALLVAGCSVAAAEPAIHGTLTELSQDGVKLPLLHLWGSPYQMGYAHGKLCAERIRQFYNYAQLGMNAAMGVTTAQLDAVWAQMSPYIAPRYKDEMQGLADGAGVNVDAVHRMHIIPDLSEFHCTFTAAWGPATRDGHLHQIRALDYEIHAGLQNYAALFDLEPAGRHRLVIPGWIGFIGAISGMSSQGIALSEIGAHFSDQCETLSGEPMPFLLRRVLEDSDGLTDAIDRFKTATRTSSYLYCVGDGKIREARALRTSHDFCEVYGPDGHGYMSLPNAVFYSMGWTSGWCQKVHNALAPAWGRIDDKTGMQTIMRGLKTGDLHAVAYDASSGDIWVANATGGPEVKPGYDQPFVHYRLKMGRRR